MPARRSVFGSVEWARICEQFRGVEAGLFAMERGQASICHPMLLRPLSGLPFAEGFEERWDATTPDYTGPVVQGDDSDLLSRFRDGHRELASQHGIVAEFAHMHPWSEGFDLLHEDCTRNREIVWINVAQDPEHIYRKDLDRSCRNKVSQAQRAGVRVVADSSDRAVAEFYRIYTGTMRRHQALDRYYFSLEYFLKIRDELPENARYVFAEHEGRRISAYLYMHDDHHVYSYLGGTDAEFAQVRPTNLVVWETTVWAHQMGKKRFILGAGYRPNDGVFQFKASFSPFRKPFYVYKRIHRHDDYARLEERFRAHHGLKDNDDDYFPSYRRTPAHA
ncbi:MAG: GNAT family N-acetyltransferase [Terracidiphilus sp.]